MQRTLLIAAIAIAFAAVSARAGTISGTVTSDAGAPLAAMTVSAYTPAGTLQASGATTASGSYALTLPAGTYRLLAFDPTGYYATSFYADAESFDTSAQLTLASSQNTTNVNFRLVRAGFAVGHVRGTDGNGIAGITVAAYNASGTRRGFAKSDAAGAFTLALPPGTYRIGAYDEALNYTTVFFANAASFTAATPVAISSGQSAITELQMALVAHLAGRVTSASSGTPVAGITAAVYDAGGAIVASATTDANGAWSVAVPAGDYRAGIFDAAHFWVSQFFRAQAQFAAATPLHANPGQTIGGIDFAAVRGARIMGRIASRSSNAPVAGGTAAAYDLAGHLIASATADASGNYVLLVPPGAAKLLAFDTSLRYATAYYLGAPSFDDAQTLSLFEGEALTADFALPDAGTFSGIVVDATSGVPLAAIDVIAYDAMGRRIAEATTNATGSFRVAVPAGSYVFAAVDESGRYAPVIYPNGAQVSVAAGQDVGGSSLRMYVATPSVSRRHAARH